MSERPGLRLLGTALVLLLLAAPLAAASAPRQDAEARRLRQLEAFEQALTKTISEFVTARVDAQVAADQQPESHQPVADSADFIVKVGTPVGAHGVYINGYGVIFSIQRPQVAVLPRAFERRLAQPFVLHLGPGTVGSGPTRNLGVIQFRTRMIEQSLRELELLLEQERARGAEAALVESRQRQIAQMRQLLARLSEDTGDAPQPVAAIPPPQDERVDATEATQRAGQPERQQIRAAESYGVGLDPWKQLVQQQRSMRELFERSDGEITRAVNDAAVETLADYGAVIKGLDSDERVSVLVFPPSQFDIARRYGIRVGQEEYVISVRYRDIRDLDNGKIDLDKFRDRVRIHNRLGTELGLESEQQPQR